MQSVKERDRSQINQLRSVMTSAYKCICHGELILAGGRREVTARLPKLRPKTCSVPVQKEFQAMDHDKHQSKILGLGLALLVATVSVLVSMHDEASSDGQALRVRDERIAVIDTSPASRAVLSKPASSLTVSSRTPMPDRR